MPAIGISILFGLIGGVVGAIILAILMMLMGSKIKASPPEIMAEMMFKDKSKKPLALFLNFGVWGIIFGIVASLAGYTAYVTNGLWFSLIPWLFLGIIMMPMAGAGVFGSKRWNMLWLVTLIMHLIWGAVTGGIFLALVGLTA